MDHVLSQLLLSAEQPQWGSKAPQGQVSPRSDSGYHSSCSLSDSGYSSACQNSDPVYFGGCLSSDPGYGVPCGSVSPASSMDSGFFSPPPLQWSALDCSPLPGPVPMATAPAPAPACPSPTQGGGRRPRSRHPGKKRQSASEREKLRMRDLAKALQHLRTFLPPSVAPAGQTLTKIETLRLAARYIARLSAQLKEDQAQGSPTGASSPRLGAQNETQSPFQPSLQTESLHSAQPGIPPPSGPSSPQLSYQNPLGDFCFTDVTSECFWIPEISHNLYGN